MRASGLATVRVLVHHCVTLDKSMTICLCYGLCCDRYSLDAPHMFVCMHGGWKDQTN